MVIRVHGMLVLMTQGRYALSCIRSAVGCYQLPVCIDQGPEVEGGGGGFRLCRFHQSM